MSSCICKRHPGGSVATLVWAPVAELCPVHGDPESNTACGGCNGCGNVSGVYADDPKWWPCVDCGGSGLA
jgi:hypothetical protein